MSSNIIKPQPLGGFRDILPEDMIVRERLMGQIKQVCERFGFVPIDTPCVEKLKVLTGGSDDFTKSIFSTRVMRGAEDGEITNSTEESLALRFDLTMSLARVIAACPELSRPFKRYQTGKVWRGEKPQKGRFREFIQFDFDIVGARGMIADTEVILLMHAVLTELGVERFLIRINNRKILNGLAEKVGVADQTTEFFRLLDKVEDVGEEKVFAEMQRQPDNEYDVTALSFTPQQINSVYQFLGLQSSDPGTLLTNLQEFFAGETAIGADGISELTQVIASLNVAGIPQEQWTIDLSVARGLDYYTGPVFETVLTDIPDIGSVLSGGRFDGLTNRFMPGSNIPGVGASVGVDRLIVGLQELGLVEIGQVVTQVLVTVFEDTLSAASLLLATELREAGINTELYLGDEPTLKAQIVYAAKRQIPHILIMGPDEQASGTVTIRNMGDRTQQAVPRSTCKNYLLELL